MKKHILYILYTAIFVLGLLFLAACESPTAVKERKQDTTIIRNNGGRN